MPAYDIESLHAFRGDLHGCFHRRADALCELVNALLAAETVTLLPHFSLQATHRRGWGGVYDALAEGRIDVAEMTNLLGTALSPGFQYDNAEPEAMVRLAGASGQRVYGPLDRVPSNSVDSWSTTQESCLIETGGGIRPCEARQPAVF